MMILQSKKRLPTGIYVNEDFSQQTKRKINILRPALREARKFDKYAKLVKDKLIFKNKAFTVHNIHTISFDTRKLSEKTDGVTLAFAGRYSPFSNFFPHTIEVKGETYRSSEHFYQFHKCMAAGATDNAAEVLLTNEPEDAMAAAADVKPAKRWYDNEGKQIMLQAIQAKFASQNMQQKLLKTGKSVLVEATRNTVWGTGIHFTSNNILNPKSYTGQNLLGRVLMEVRSCMQNQQENSSSQPAEPAIILKMQLTSNSQAFSKSSTLKDETQANVFPAPQMIQMQADITTGSHPPTAASSAVTTSNPQTTDQVPSAPQMIPMQVDIPTGSHSPAAVSPPVTNINPQPRAQASDQVPGNATAAIATSTHCLLQDDENASSSL